jgi:hypothetical protein
MLWKTIAGFTDYQVSDTGLVRRITLGTHKKPGDDLLAQTDTDGYKFVCLFRDGKRRYFKVHRLVAAAFLGAPMKGTDHAAHIDGTRQNNRADNLMWATCQENLSHRRHHGTELLGERNGRAKLTAEQVAEIRRRYKPRHATEGAAALGREFGVTDVAICKIASRQTWGRV